LGKLVYLMNPVPITVILIILTTVYAIWKKMSDMKNERKQRERLITMEENLPHAQWVIICGNDKDIIQSYISQLTKGRLRILLAYVGAAIPDVKGYDKAIQLDDATNLTEFLSYRHVKILINMLPVSQENIDSIQSTMTKFIELAFVNMMQHKSGCIITVNSPDSLNNNAGLNFSGHSKKLLLSVIDKITSQIYTQDVTIKSKSSDEIKRTVNRSIEGIGVLNQVA